MEKKYKKVETIQMPKVDEILDNFTPSPEQQQRAQFVDWIVLDKLAPDQLFTKVWNTHVVPLDAENKALREENLRLQNRVSSLENICEMDRKTEYQYNQLYKEKEALRDHIESCEQDNKLLREENTRLTTKFIEEEHAADHPNENLSYWQYQQFTRAAITKLREEIERLKEDLNDAYSKIESLLEN